jgi:hypothetical protein
LLISMKSDASFDGDSKTLMEHHLTRHAGTRVVPSR